MLDDVVHVGKICGSKWSDIFEVHDVDFHAVCVLVVFLSCLELCSSFLCAVLQVIR